MTSNNRSSIVLLTGATGFIGFRILLDVLEAGYTVKAVVRSPAKTDALLQNPTLRELNATGRLTFPNIPDFAIEGAWDKDIQDVEFIIHVASPLPLPFLDPGKDIFQPSVKANDNLLKAVLGAPKLKRLILTSSIVATMPLPPRGPGPYNAAGSVPTPSEPFANVYDAYQGSKIHLINSSRELVERHHPTFDVINVVPGYVFGRNKSATTAQGMFTSSNALLLMLLKGRVFSGTRTAGAAHLDDVTKVHVKMLDLSVPGNTSYGVSINMQYNDAISIAKKHFPDAFEKGVFTDKGDQPSETVQWDASETEEALSVRFKGYEQMVVDVVSQYLELLAGSPNI